MHQNALTDQQKRQTLKSMTCVAASGLSAVFSAHSAATIFSSYDAGRAYSPVAIEATLISSPDVLEDTLLLHNVTDKHVMIERFHANMLVFDGELVDCNGACSDRPISIPPGLEISVQFSRLTQHNLNAMAGEYLDVDTYITRLPGGTRIIPLVARMRGNAAMLSESI